jgi:hypothetical protein
MHQLFINDDIFMQQCDDDALRYGAVCVPQDWPQQRAFMWFFTH